MTETDERRSRLARRVFPEGTEPDPRFTLANERTFLAWMRTALAFIAGGVALKAFSDASFSSSTRKVLAVCVVCVGLVIGLAAAFRWVSVERSMRERRPLPFPVLVPLLSLGAAVAAVTSILLVLSR